MATSGAMPSRPTKKKATPTPPEPPKALTVEERYATLEERLKTAPAEALAKYLADLDMSWIAHDSALEGVVYTLAVRWLVTYARERREKGMSDKLANEILDALNQQGGAYKRKDDIYRMAQANKAFAHYRW